ncbi:MAG TPA: FtsX-like permease family protein [Burkholderiales bacterium]|nr:FtsX-like permease family protein [Burkholderiales bacterium]
MIAPWRPAVLTSLWRASAGGAWREHPGRLVLALLGIALGVALGVAVHLINASATNEFELAVRSLAGEADLVVRGPRSGFPESLYPRLARAPGVAAASPALEVDAQIAGRRDTIKVLGLDSFRALQVQPHLLLESRDALTDLLKPRQALLSAAAAEDLGVGKGGELRVHAGSRVETLHVAGVLAPGATRQRMAIVDIAEAQRVFGRIGDLSRIDLKLAAGTQAEAFARTLESVLPAGTVVATPEAEAARNVSLSRAYRTNLDMLALVALFTGAFLVFSTQFLALLRRRSQLALLRVIGVTRGQLVRLLLVDASLTGLIGSLLGVALGVALAHFAVARLGGDLGAGYFSAVDAQLHVDPAALATFFVLGVVFSLIGAALPALEAARRQPATALKAGDEEEALRGVQRAAPGLAIIAIGLALSQAPPLGDLPWTGYAAIALLLVGAILVMPRFAHFALARLPNVRRASAALAAAQLQATPRQVAVALAGILASFSLMVSMIIMIGSFRESLATWLDRMLPADLYLRAGRLGDTGFFSEEEQARIARVAGIERAVFLRSQSVFVARDRPPLTLIARPLAPGQSAPPLPFEGPRVEPAAGAPTPVWLSEVAADVLRVSARDIVTLPIGGVPRHFTVAGIWRDYARQNGAVVIDRAVYVAITRDRRANEAWLYLAGGVAPDEAAARLRAGLVSHEGLEIATPRELKSISLAIFDRTFAVTYALEVAAVLIGLFGVSASFSAQALARRREFGVLRHIGMTRRQIGSMLAFEGLAVGSVGVVAGLALGWLVSLVLVHVINRQSFHWSMDMHIPWGELGVLALSLVVAATLTAVVSGRRAMSDEVTRAVREDW